MVAVAGGWNPARGPRVRGTAQRELEKWGAGSGPFTWSPAREGLVPVGQARWHLS